MAPRRRYDTDLTDMQWAAVASLVPDAKPGGWPRTAPKRELVEAIPYAQRSGHAWRLPHDFPPWRTVYHYLCAWQADGSWARIHHAGRSVRRRSAVRSGTGIGQDRVDLVENGLDQSDKES